MSDPILLSLPAEMQSRIVELLPRKDLKRLRLVCKTLSAIAIPILFKEIRFRLDGTFRDATQITTKLHELEIFLDRPSSFPRYFRHVAIEARNLLQDLEPALVTEFVIGAIPKDVLTTCAVEVEGYTNDVRFLATLFRSQTRLRYLGLTAAYDTKDGICYILPSLASRMKSLRALSLRYGFFDEKERPQTLLLWKTLLANLPVLEDLEIKGQDYEHQIDPSSIGSIFDLTAIKETFVPLNLTTLTFTDLDLDDCNTTALNNTVNLPCLSTLILRNCCGLPNFLDGLAGKVSKLRHFIYQRDFCYDSADLDGPPNLLESKLETFLVSFEGLLSFQFSTLLGTNLPSPNIIIHHADTLESLSICVSMPEEEDPLPSHYSQRELSLITQSCKNIKNLSLWLPPLTQHPSLKPSSAPDDFGDSNVADGPRQKFWQYLDSIFTLPKLQTFRTTWLPNVPASWSRVSNDVDQNAIRDEKIVYSLAYESLKDDLISSIVKRFATKATNLERISIGSAPPGWRGSEDATWPYVDMENGSMVEVGNPPWENYGYEIASARLKSRKCSRNLWEKTQFADPENRWARLMPSAEDFF